MESITILKYAFVSRRIYIHLVFLNFAPERQNFLNSSERLKVELSLQLCTNILTDIQHSHISSKTISEKRGSLSSQVFYFVRQLNSEGLFWNVFQ